jgi:GrpB-like predicted nucleotidyltransferase (UPF0157 family)
MRKVDVLPHDRQWHHAFTQEKQQLLQVLGDRVIRIHHMGSTAIPGIFAKPIIDLLVEVTAIARVDECDRSMEAIGYVVMGEHGIPDRRYSYKENSAGIRTHHVHIFEGGTSAITQHLAFRDYLIAHPDEAQRYSELKRELAQQYPYDIDRYIEGKAGFVQAMNQKAYQWQTTHPIP